MRTDFVLFVGFLAVITVGPFVFFTEGDFVAFTFTFETLSRVLRAFQGALMPVFLGVEVLVAVRGGSLELVKEEMRLVELLGEDSWR